MLATCLFPRQPLLGRCGVRAWFEMEPTERVLFAFDWDHTVVAENSDLWVMDMAPSLRLKERIKELRATYNCWTDLMEYVMKELHCAGCSKEQIEDYVGQMELISGMESIFKQIGECSSADLVVISDSNSIFIQSVLAHHGLLGAVKSVHTNPAHWDESGRLRIRRCMSHCCVICEKTPNMCKGTILYQLLAEKGLYSRVVYVGDGFNDFCPALKLTHADHVVARKGYSLAHRLGKEKSIVAAHCHVLDFFSPELMQVLLGFLPGLC